MTGAVRDFVKDYVGEEFLMTIIEITNLIPGKYLIAAYSL